MKRGVAQEKQTRVATASRVSLQLNKFTQRQAPRAFELDNLA